MDERTSVLLRWVDLAKRRGWSEEQIAGLACYGAMCGAPARKLVPAASARAASILAWLTLVHTPALDVVEVALMPWRLEMLAEGLLGLDELLQALPDDDELLEQHGQATRKEWTREPEVLWRRVSMTLARWNGEASLDDQVVQACMSDVPVGVRWQGRERRLDLESQWLRPLWRAAARWAASFPMRASLPMVPLDGDTRPENSWSEHGASDTEDDRPSHVELVTAGSRSSQGAPSNDDVGRGSEGTPRFAFPH